MCVNVRGCCRSWLSHSTMWVTRKKLCSSGSVAVPFPLSSLTIIPICFYKIIYDPYSRVCAHTHTHATV